MSLLRIYASLLDSPTRCQWALVGQGSESLAGEGRLADLPRRAERVQLVVPAAQVLITRARVPQEARRRAGAALAFAVEEQTAGEPEMNQVSWLGTVGENDVLAVVDKPGLHRWRDALNGAGFHDYEVHGETFLLPWTPGQWSLAWNGREGFVRTGQFEGAATDCGDRENPPQSLRMMLAEVEAQGVGPGSIAVYTTAAEAEPDIDAWTRALGLAVSLAGPWDWRNQPADAGISLAQERQGWRALAGTFSRLRPAGWILLAALAIQTIAMLIDWSVLAQQQRSLRQQMETRFRAAFPDAVAVVDPVLQMRRKLAEARHAAGQVDSGDFLPMIEKVAAAMRDLPAGALRIVSYESGRMTLEIASSDAAAMKRVTTRLTQAGLTVEPAAAARAGGTTVVLTVRAS